jgi:PIN domain nuclease of toxin-antitoxin system
VNVLLDTCALVALARGDLPARAGAALKGAGEAAVSTVSPWEVAIKVAAGKLRLRDTPASWFLGLCERYDLREIPLDAPTACAAAALPAVHRDPFDRVLVALARARSLVILTSDDNIPKYPGVTTLW